MQIGGWLHLLEEWSNITDLMAFAFKSLIIKSIKNYYGALLWPIRRPSLISSPLAKLHSLTQMDYYYHNSCSCAHL